MPASKKDEISREAYREMFHRVQAELNQLKQDIVRNQTTTEAFWEEAEATVVNSAGYYRFGRSRNGHYWFRFKWTEGPLAGRYAIGGHSTLCNAFLACQTDIDLCLSGKKVPPLDVGYKGKAK